MPKCPHVQVKTQAVRDLDPEEVFQVLIAAERASPGILEAVRHALSQETPMRRVNCPFPWKCLDFPCLLLQCSADSLENGFAYRRS